MTTLTPRPLDPLPRAACLRNGHPHPAVQRPSPVDALCARHAAFKRTIGAVPSDGDALQIALALDALMDDACARAAAPRDRDPYEYRFALRQTLEDIDHLAHLLRARCRLPRNVGIELDQFTRALHAAASA